MKMWRHWNVEHIFRCRFNASPASHSFPSKVRTSFASGQITFACAVHCILDVCWHFLFSISYTICWASSYGSSDAYKNKNNQIIYCQYNTRIVVIADRNDPIGTRMLYISMSWERNCCIIFRISFYSAVRWFWFPDHIFAVDIEFFRIYR